MLETIWLHIGAEKTGTTTIQRSLEASREALSEHGVLFPTTFGQFNHTHLAAYAMDDDRGIEEFRIRAGLSDVADLPGFRAKLLEDIKAEIAKSGCHSLVLSNEHCSSRLTRPSEIIRLKDFLSSICADVRIVLYIRRPEDFLASWYSTSVTSGNCNNFPWPVSKALIRAVDWFDLANNWQEVFWESRISLRRLDSGKMIKGDLLEDFYGTLGLANIKFTVPSRWNESLSLEAIVFLRHLNKHLPYIKEGKVNSERGNINGKLGKWRGGTPFRLSMSESAAVNDVFQESYEALRLRYFPEDASVFSDTNAAPTESCRNRTLTTDEFAELTAFMWKNR